MVEEVEVVRCLRSLPFLLLLLLLNGSLQMKEKRERKKRIFVSHSVILDKTQSSRIFNSIDIRFKGFEGYSRKGIFSSLFIECSQKVCLLGHIKGKLIYTFGINNISKNDSRVIEKPSTIGIGTDAHGYHYKHFIDKTIIDI